MLCSVIYYIVTFYRAKHPTKVQVWAGISWLGRTGICIFEGIMNAHLYVEILESALLPFIESVYPDGQRLMQDNDPKYCSNYTKDFYEIKGTNWMKMPAESPDLNPIENLWHEVKYFLRREIKLKTKNELVAGIQQFWETVTIEKCRKYIGHSCKVIPKVIDLDGAATGY